MGFGSPPLGEVPTVLFDSWYDVWRVIAAGAFGYALIVASVRVTGKRTLAKMNAFDLTVTVALGSVLATIALSADVSLAEGAAAIGVLLGAQLAVSWTSVRFVQFRKLTRTQPTVVFIGDGAKSIGALLGAPPLDVALPEL